MISNNSGQNSAENPEWLPLLFLVADMVLLFMMGYAYKTWCHSDKNKKRLDKATMESREIDQQLKDEIERNKQQLNALIESTKDLEAIAKEQEIQIKEQSQQIQVLNKEHQILLGSTDTPTQSSESPKQSRSLISTWSRAKEYPKGDVKQFDVTAARALQPAPLTTLTPSIITMSKTLRDLHRTNDQIRTDLDARAPESEQVSAQLAASEELIIGHRTKKH